jgi:2-iminobutanoate/2-iminopropanoate deaminase
MKAQSTSSCFVAQKTLTLLVASLVCLSACAGDVQFLSVDGAAKGLPFSPAVRVGGQLYVSGQIGTLPGTTKLVAGGMAEEAKQTIENVKTILVANGYSLRDVVKCTVMLADMNEWTAFNEIDTAAFTPPYPARSAIGANGLARGAKVELDCIAAK